MAPLLYSDIIKALPADETKSSYLTYRSYLNKLSAIGYKEGADILEYIDNPLSTCEELKEAGLELKDAINVIKALKFFAGKANKFLEYDIDMARLENYKSDIVDKVYGPVIKQPRPVNCGASDDAVTEIDDEPALPDLNMRRVSQSCADLKCRMCAMEERMIMMEKMILEVAKAYPNPGMIELLYGTAMQSFV